jgi:hypothetical protein
MEENMAIQGQTGTWQSKSYTALPFTFTFTTIDYKKSNC